MAQRLAGPGTSGAKSTLAHGFDDPKQFDKRVTLESKKIKDLLAAVDKGRAQLESERKAYCEDFKKFLIAYVGDENAHSTTYATQLQNIVRRLDELNGHYQLAIKHITDVSMPALGFLPKRFETLKKSIKVAKQVPAEIPKIRDFEWERLENLQQAMLHFFNAKMYLHAKALELYSAAYETLRAISVRNEFRQYDQQTMRQIFASNPQIQATPRGGGGSNSARQNSQEASARGHPSPNTGSRQAAAQQRPQSSQQRQPSAQASGQRQPSAGASGQRSQQSASQQQARRPQ